MTTGTTLSLSRVVPTAPGGAVLDPIGDDDYSQAGQEASSDRFLRRLAATVGEKHPADVLIRFAGQISGSRFQKCGRPIAGPLTVLGQDRGRCLRPWDPPKQKKQPDQAKLSTAKELPPLARVPLRKGPRSASARACEELTMHLSEAKRQAARWPQARAYGWPIDEEKHNKNHNDDEDGDDGYVAGGSSSNSSSCNVTSKSQKGKTDNHHDVNNRLGGQNNNGNGSRNSMIMTGERRASIDQILHGHQAWNQTRRVSVSGDAEKQPTTDPSNFGPRLSVRRHSSSNSARRPSSTVSGEAGGQAGTATSVDGGETIASCDGDIPPEFPLPWSEEELRIVFRKFSTGEDREVHVEDLFNVLEYLGSRPDLDVVNELIKEVSDFATVNWTEFMTFTRLYHLRDLVALKQQFQEADLDSNGVLDPQELHVLLQSSGYSPTESVTLEAIAVTDTDGNGCLDFSEFHRLREHLRKNRGFLLSEAAELQKLFDRIARGPEKCLRTQDLDRVRRYLGYCLPEKEVIRIGSKIDRDASGQMNFDELLQLVRMMQDYEQHRLLKLVNKITKHKQKAEEAGHRTTVIWDMHGTTGIGAHETQQVLRDYLRQQGPPPIHIDHVDSIMAKMGYYASFEVVQEILATKFSIDSEDALLSVSEMNDLLRAYRACEGFTDRDLEELRDAFKQEQAVSVAGSSDEELDALECGRVLRWFGVSRTLQQVRHMIDELDLDGRQQLEFKEFTKLMRVLFQEENRERRLIFDRVTIRGRMAAQQLPSVLNELTGLPCDDELVAQCLSETRLSGELLQNRWKPAPGASASAAPSASSPPEAASSSTSPPPPPPPPTAGPSSAPDNAPGKEAVVAAAADAASRPTTAASKHARNTLNRHQFEAFFHRYRRRMTDKVRMNAGYTAREVIRLRTVFDSYDTAKKGVLDDVGMRKIIEDYMPEAKLTIQGKEETKKLLAQLASRTQATMTKTTSARKLAPPTLRELNFDQFILLMRKFYDIRDEKDIVREEEAVRVCNYTLDQVEGFRQIFLSCVDSSGELDLHGLTKLLGNISKLERDERETLRELVRNLSPECREVVRFPQFLLLVHQASIANLFGLNAAAEQIVRKMGQASGKTPSKIKPEEREGSTKSPASPNLLSKGRFSRRGSRI